MESALRRFSHFGMAKTTMAEIAKDLSFSKALLYYYFPDKNSLYAAVWNYLLDELLERGEKIIEEGGELATIVSKLLDARMHFFNEYYNIFADAYSFRMELPMDLQDLIPKIYQKEIQQVVNLLKVGVANGEIALDDEYDTARLFQASMHGLRAGLKKDFKTMFAPPTQDEFNEILTMQKKMATIFINGLRVR
ncbi:TetR/AcrR family transcriptional regulator [Sphingobacterium corticis]|uniref:TetR/AcrR family transcriptional regulator n=1 Tax=Sphingobacterium corticis TaxID=1812823 RepID=A0ABW5NHF7_9SPHI